MKVVGFVGSPRKDGNTYALVNQILEGAKEKGAETKIINLNKLNIKGCQACMYCRTNYGCAIKDDMQELYEEIKTADAIVLGSPVYMFQVSAQTKAFIDRLFIYLNLDYTSKIKKDTVLAITQGNADIQAFKHYLKSTVDALNLIGFPLKSVLIAGNGLEKDAVAKDVEVMARAKETGKHLVN